MMGLSYNDLYDLTPRSFSNASKGFFELRKEDIRTSWEQVRVIAHVTASPHLKNKIKAQELLPFPWDKENKKKRVKIASPEEIKKVIKSYENNKIKKIN